MECPSPGLLTKQRFIGDLTGWVSSHRLLGMVLSPKTPAVLAIAGFDPSSGAGITADLKTIAAHRCYGLAAITALTVQNSFGVKEVSPVEPTLLRQTVEALFSDSEIAAIKI